MTPDEARMELAAWLRDKPHHNLDFPRKWFEKMDAALSERALAEREIGLAHLADAAAWEAYRVEPLAPMEKRDIAVRATATLKAAVSAYARRFEGVGSHIPPAGRGRG